MKFSLSSISFIAICTLPKVYSKGSWCAGCSFFGTSKDMCGEVVAAKSLPPECETLFFYGLRTDESLKIIDSSLDGVPNRAFIDDLDTIGKPLYLYYGRSSIDDWIKYLGCISQNGGGDVKKEITNLSTYLGQFKNVAGLIFNHLSIDPDVKLPSDFTANFKKYLDELKKSLSKYSFGMEIISRQLVDLDQNSKLSQWLDLKVIDSCIDFYTLDLFYFNDCTPDFKIGGTSPISGKNGRTLDQLVAAATKAGVSQSKIYFGYRSGGTQIKGGDLCGDTSSICKKKTLDGFCSDNTQTFYDKGTFASKHGIGFVMTNTDLSDDPNGVCQCETPYPAFHDVLAGFKALPVPKPCPLLDKC